MNTQDADRMRAISNFEGPLFADINDTYQKTRRKADRIALAIGAVSFGLLTWGSIVTSGQPHRETDTGFIFMNGQYYIPSEDWAAFEANMREAEQEN